MIFLIMLIATTVAIAGSAAFFSVYGLAYTFSGTFWSVVVMGGSLEAGKLMTASYLYRYWTETHAALRWYLMAGVLALMILTSTGIFSYLSAGYQADVLPLKQMNEQVRLLEEERTRSITRKTQIDDQLIKGPSVGSVNSGDKIDPNAARTIREARRAQESTGKQYKAEQQALQVRVAELDKQLLELKQDLVKLEAHIGPITYVAKVFDMAVDDATKYLIFLIIFAFDPMAVALTLAVNVVLRLRREEQEVKRERQKEALDHEYFPEEVAPPIVVERAPSAFPTIYTDSEIVIPPEPELEPEPESEPVSVPTPEAIAEIPPKAIEPAAPIRPASRRTRPYGEHWSPVGNEHRIGELVGHYKYLQGKQKAGEQLSPDDIWEFNAIHDILQKHGYLHYLN
jgi:hypothetical protein